MEATPSLNVFAFAGRGTVPRLNKLLAFRDEFRERWDLEPGSCNAGLSQDYANFLIKVLQRTYEEYGELSKENIYKVGIEEVMTGKPTYTEGILMKEYKFTPETAPDPVVGGDYFM